jgi:regulator of sirC expression with transglutaminase-like and TPR domain
LTWADETSADEAQIAKLIEQLGSPTFEEREAALKSLRQLGQKVLGPLAEARNHKSPEVRSRAAMLLRQLDLVPLQTAFVAFARQPDEKLSLEEGMWLISRIVNRSAQRALMEKQLDALANSVRKKLGPDVVPRTIAPERLVAVLCEVVFEDEKFDGNEADYHNPDNSSLERVLQTKKGLPILLSHLVVAVGRRLEVPIVGLPTPGRYIVKYDGQQAPPGFAKKDIYFDPYGHGRVLTEEIREQLFPGIVLERIKPQSARDDLIRMLHNIESHLFGRDETDKAYLAVEFRIALQEQAPANKE